MIKQEKLRPCEKFQQEGREWDRLVVHRKDTTGDEAVVGHTQLRKDAVEKVTGTALYGADANFPGQLYGALTRSPHPHARIKAVRVEKAKAVPGVRAVVTGADYPEPYGQFIADQTSSPWTRSATRGSRWPPWRRRPRRLPGRPLLWWRWTMSRCRW